VAFLFVPPRPIILPVRRALPVLIPLLVFTFAGVWGVDFGQHWDETEHLQNVSHSLQTETLLPTAGYTLDKDRQLALGYYAYPSVIYWITLASAAPEILPNITDVTPPWLARFIMTQPFRLRVRAVCCVLSSLAILWVYLALLRLTGSILQAFFAACLVAGSWEVSYHGRWLAPDALVMLFGALCLYCCCGAAASKTPRVWITAAALAAGLAAGTKYPGALLLIPTLIIAWHTRPSSLSTPHSALSTAKTLARLCLIALITFFITTPGAILQPWPFFHWLAFQRRLYGFGTHWGYTVAGHADCLAKIAVYEFIVLFSHLPWIAAALTLLIPFGAFALWKRSPPLAVAVLAFLLIYTAYFATQRVMIVRNMLILTPFLAVLIAQGAADLLQRIPRPAWRYAAAVPLAAAVVYNITFTIYAAYTINQPPDGALALTDYIKSHPQTRFYLSPAVRDLLTPTAAPTPSGDGPARVVVLSDESDVLQWPANTWNLAAEQFGPWEVNFNYYPTWRSSRIVMLDLDRARSLPVDSVQRVLRSAGLAQ
jgi:4-amino-4-deoxy-L-arabinose transferase-like glycosyltransferase